MVMPNDEQDVAKFKNDAVPRFVIDLDAHYCSWCLCEVKPLLTRLTVSKNELRVNSSWPFDCSLHGEVGDMRAIHGKALAGFVVITIAAPP